MMARWVQFVKESTYLNIDRARSINVYKRKASGPTKPEVWIVAVAFDEIDVDTWIQEFPADQEKQARIFARKLITGMHDIQHGSI